MLYKNGKITQNNSKWLWRYFKKISISVINETIWTYD